MLDAEKIKRIINRQIFDYWYSQLNDFCYKQIDHNTPYQFDIKNNQGYLEHDEFKGCLENDQIKVTFNMNVYNKVPLYTNLLRNYFFIENLTY